MKDYKPTIYDCELEKCSFGYHTPVNRICKNRDLPSRMYDTKFGKVCINCHRVLEQEGAIRVRKSKK